MKSEKWDNMTNEQLCLEYQETKSNDLFEYFIDRNAPLMNTYLHKYLDAFYTKKDELISRAYECTWRCMLKYNPEKNCKFSTFYHYYMLMAVSLFLRNANLIRIPAHLIQDYKTNKELLAKAICSSLNEDIINEDGRKTERIETIANPDEIEPVDMLDNDHHILKSLLSTLSPRSELVMRYYLGLYDGRHHTLDYIGKQFGVTRERIRQIIVAAIKKIRPVIHKYYDVDPWVPKDDESDKIYTRPKRGYKMDD